MRRADRLFQVIQILRRRGTVTAAGIAEELEVSRRTVYRDIQDMMANGVPIVGEAGIGFALRAGYDLPPLMFNEQELEALVLGARILQSCADPQLGRAADDVIAKIRAVLPQRLRPHIDALSLWAPGDPQQESISIDRAALRAAIRYQRKINFAYVDLQDVASVRTVRPLIMAFYGPVWLLAAWCEMRNAFRVFRLDRMTEMSVLDEPFRQERGKTAADFLKQDAGYKHQ